eukprot:COSAG05_NODE_818_length_7136_cov_1156.705841_10_plen_153_part_00
MTSSCRLHLPLHSPTPGSLIPLFVLSRYKQRTEPCYPFSREQLEHLRDLSDAAAETQQLAQQANPKKGKTAAELEPPPKLSMREALAATSFLYVQSPLLGQLLELLERGEAQGVELGPMADRSGAPSTHTLLLLCSRSSVLLFFCFFCCGCI